MDPFVFWSSPKQSWPWTPDRDGVVFLATAMYRLGRARYGDQWNNREAALASLTPLDPLPDRWFDATPEQLAVARGVALAFPEGVFVLPLDPWADFSLGTAPVSSTAAPLAPDDWELAKTRVEEIRSLCSTSYGKWLDIVEATFGLLKVGALETKLRPDAGGAYAAPPLSLWNTDLYRVRERFWNCQVDLANPFDQLYAERPANPLPGKQHDFHLIFVTTASLDAVLTKIKVAPGATQLTEPEGPQKLEKRPVRTRRPRAPSAERRAILGYCAEHLSHWGQCSNRELADRVRDWVNSSADRKKEYRIGVLDESAVRRLKDDIKDGKASPPQGS